MGQWADVGLCGIVLNKVVLFRIKLFSAVFGCFVRFRAVFCGFRLFSAVFGWFVRFPVVFFRMRLFPVGKFAITPRGDIEGILRGYGDDYSEIRGKGMAEEIKRHKAIGELRFYDGLELIGQKEIDEKNGNGLEGWE